MTRAIVAVGLFVWGVLAPHETFAACAGDCGGDGQVTVDELVQGVNIALDNTPLSQCPVFDSSGDGQVTINELISAVNSALNGCGGVFAGDYAGTLDLGGQTGTLDLTVDADGQATGSLVVGSASLVSRFVRALTFPVGGVSVALTGNVDPAAGSFDISGSYIDSTGQTVPVHIGGTLPGPTGSVSITAQIGDESFGGTLSPSGATPTPTPGPTPPPISGCADAAFAVTFSNASPDTNAITSTLILGKGSALDQPDTLGAFIWVITGSVCHPVFGEVARGIVFQGIGMATRIQPGTYTLASPTPPFLNVSYTETKFTLDPSQNFAHMWVTTGGTLVIEDAGGGALRVHATNVTMAKGLVFQGAVGTFTLDISGTIDTVMHGGT